MTMSPSNPGQPQGLTPDSLVNQLFDAALKQSASKDPREVSQYVIDFLGGALVYALTSSKRVVPVFLLETLIYALSTPTLDAAKRKDLLKQMSDAIVKSSAGPVAIDIAEALLAGAGGSAPPPSNQP